jgi:signal transduction histidine kinase
VEWLRDLFETNRIIVLSVYGQVFFIMGLAIALQSRKRSELALARPLPWLAAFGIVHGFVEWGYLFVPIQSGFLPPPIIHGLLWAQLALKGISFALLLQCGAELLLSARAAAPGTGIATRGAPTSGETAIGPFGQPWLRLAPSIALVLWAVGTGAISIALHPDFAPNAHPWLAAGQIDRAVAMVGAPLAIGDVLARYMLALPGSALVVIGLWRNAAALGPLAGPPVGTALRLATVAFGIYAVLGGLIGMGVPFPPASVINSTVIRDALGIPIEVLRSITGLVIAIAVIRVLDLFEQETDRALADARRNALLLRERERIGRDLHDGIIQSIYAVGLHVEEASAALGQTGAEAPEQPEAQVQHRLQTVMSELNRITGDIRSYIFDLRSADLESRDAEEIFATVAEELRANTLIDLDLRVEGDYRPKLTGEQAEQLRHIAQEAFSNVLRHARAKRVEVTLRCTRRQFTVEICDDGVGYDPAAAPARSRRGGAQGLANIRRRAEILGARLSMQSQPGQGSALSLTMPVTATRRSA